MLYTHYTILYHIPIVYDSISISTNAMDPKTSFPTVRVATEIIPEKYSDGTAWSIEPYRTDIWWH